MFTGDINGTAINETFDTADGKFNAVEPANALQFPIQIGDPAQNVQAVQAAQADAQSARTLAYVGIAVGVLGILVGLGAWAARPRAASVTRASTQPATERT
jgi:hypothetical protein